MCVGSVFFSVCLFLILMGTKHFINIKKTKTEKEGDETSPTNSKNQEPLQRYPQGYLVLSTLSHSHKLPPTHISGTQIMHPPRNNHLSGVGLPFGKGPQ